MYRIENPMKFSKNAKMYPNRGQKGPLEGFFCIFFEVLNTFSEDSPLMTPV